MFCWIKNGCKICFYSSIKKLKSNGKRFKSLGCHIQPLWRHNSENIMAALKCRLPPHQETEGKGRKESLLYENSTQPDAWSLCSFTLALSHLSPNQFSYHPRLVTTGELRKRHPSVPRIRLADKILNCRQNKVLPLPLETTA